ncbi:hypothetical protein Tcan_18720 [Toxocara canis]|uniref:C2H2-type domain-containing protein n=1 Tax=Toxocara canis TaxID=6265 RepID=A0A0B2VX94_TOXCA|nr:hypothetical protein Tcan_18720 [Toxocara canis]
MVSRRKQARPVKRSAVDWDKSLLDSTTVDAYCLPVVGKCTSSTYSCASALAGRYSEEALPSNTTPAPPESSSNELHNVLPNPCSCVHTFASSSRSHPYWILHEESNSSAEYDNVSPLKCLESIVKPKEELALRHAAKRVPSVQPSCYGSQRNAFTNSASSPYMLQTKTEAERSSKGESNALCELSQLVHKVGSVRHSTCTEVHAESNCAKSVFTCLQCSCSFETLDHLVFHISTTKHFTRIATKHIEPVFVFLFSSLCMMEAERSSKGESNALCELSQLVHKVGSVRHSTCTEVHAESNCAKSVFTCLQCSCSFETLDHLVFHISTTKHFTRIATKHIEPVAPWEKGVVATHHRDKERSQRARILECTLCGQTFEGKKCANVARREGLTKSNVIFLPLNATGQRKHFCSCDAGYHLRFKHKLDSFMDWISVIKIAEASPNPDKNAFALNKLQTLVNGVKK